MTQSPHSRRGLSMVFNKHTVVIETVKVRMVGYEMIQTNYMKKMVYISFIEYCAFFLFRRSYLLHYIVIELKLHMGIENGISLTNHIGDSYMIMSVGKCTFSARHLSSFGRTHIICTEAHARDKKRELRILRIR